LKGIKDRGREVFAAALKRGGRGLVVLRIGRRFRPDIYLLSTLLTKKMIVQ
jgi:hypothetical protein